jgi:hypothetical protein
MFNQGLNAARVRCNRSIPELINEKWLNSSLICGTQIRIGEVEFDVWLCLE